MRRLHRDETAKNGDKAQEDELWLLWSKVKVTERSTMSLTTIGAGLENIQRQLDVMKSGDWLQAQVETGLGIPTKDVQDLNWEE